MKRRTKINLYFILALVVVIIGVLEFPFVTNSLVDTLGHNKASKGAINLSEIDVDKGDRAYLRGDWEFYWNTFLISDGVKERTPDLMVSIPSMWSEYSIDGKALTNGGHASYRLLLNNLKADEPFIVCVPNLAAAYKAYINGVLIYESGKTSLTDGTTTATTSFTAYPIVIDTSELPNGECELILEVACTLSGGLSMTPVLVNHEAYYSYAMFMVGARYLFIGSILFCALYALILFKMNRSSDYLPWLALLCICLSTRMMISCEGYWASQLLFSGLDYELMNFLIYISTFVIKLVMLIYVSRALKLKIPQNFAVAASAVFLAFAFVPYFLADNIYDPSVFLTLQFSTFIFDAYMLYKLCTVLADKVEWALIYLFGYIFVITGLSVDTLYTSGMISARVSTFMPLMFFLFICSAAAIQTKRVSKSYKAISEAARLSEEVAQLNMQLMLSQIQPHFLYNALNTIKYLTKRDPKKAEAAIVSFSNYLRANMDSLSEKEPVPFESELNHIRNYVSIELIRFDERLKMEYDIQCDSFLLPPLTIQPIVENAIKHGVNQKPEGGTVKLSSYDDKKNFYVLIEDDGVGYDVNEIPVSERSHIGLHNISIRLKYMLDAKVEVKSEIGVGTRVLITIPKSKKSIYKILEQEDK